MIWPVKGLTANSAVVQMPTDGATRCTRLLRVKHKVVGGGSSTAAATQHRADFPCQLAAALTGHSWTTASGPRSGQSRPQQPHLARGGMRDRSEWLGPGHRYPPHRCLPPQTVPGGARRGAGRVGRERQESAVAHAHAAGTTASGGTVTAARCLPQTLDWRLHTHQQHSLQSQLVHSLVLNLTPSVGSPAGRNCAGARLRQAGCGGGEGGSAGEWQPQENSVG